jgi:hypothetical protein
MTVRFHPSEPDSILTPERSTTMNITQSPVPADIPAPITHPAGWYRDPFDHTIMRWWDGHAWTAYTQQTVQSVVVHQDRGKPVNHALHLILSILTAGLWLPVWLIIAIAKN